MSFWLMKYGSPSPKRLMLRSNWRDIKHMDLGRLPREEAARKTTLKTSCLNPGLHACIYIYIIHASYDQVGKEKAGVERRHYGTRSGPACIIFMHDDLLFELIAVC